MHIFGGREGVTDFFMTPSLPHGCFSPIYSYLFTLSRWWSNLCVFVWEKKQGFRRLCFVSFGSRRKGDVRVWVTSNYDSHYMAHQKNIHIFFSTSTALQNPDSTWLGLFSGPRFPTTRAQGREVSYVVCMIRQHLSTKWDLVPVSDW